MPLPELQQPNIVGSYLQGLNFSRQNRRQDLLDQMRMKEFEQRKTLADIQVEQAERLAETQDRQAKRQEKMDKLKIFTTGFDIIGKSKDTAQGKAAYAAYLNQIEKMGYPVSPEMRAVGDTINIKGDAVDFTAGKHKFGIPKNNMQAFTKDVADKLADKPPGEGLTFQDDLEIAQKHGGYVKEVGERESKLFTDAEMKQKKEMERFKAGLAKPAAQKAYTTPEGTVEYLEGTKEPPKGWIPYSKPGGDVTWTTATNNLSKRFGKQDAVGNIIITPELQNRHRLAQKKLVELKDANVDPLKAVNEAELYANKVEENFNLYLKSAKTKEQKEKVKNQFKAKYGYLP